MSEISVLAGHVALVTGGARRLGRHIALALARAGADVAISYHASADAAAETAANISAIGRRSLALPCDVRSASAVAQAFDQVVSSLGALDILVANAGVFARTPIAEVTAADWDAQVRINLTGVFFCAQQAGLRMRRGGGSIILIADVAGLAPWKHYVPYSVSKACVIALARSLAIELAPSVRVNAVAPGLVLPPEGLDQVAFQETVRRTPLGRPGHPDDVADAVVYLAAAHYVTGVTMPVDGGRHLASTDQR